MTTVYRCLCSALLAFFLAGCDSGGKERCGNRVALYLVAVSSPEEHPAIEFDRCDVSSVIATPEEVGLVLSESASSRLRVELGRYGELGDRAEFALMARDDREDQPVARIEKWQLASTISLLELTSAGGVEGVLARIANAADVVRVPGIAESASLFGESDELHRRAERELEESRKLRSEGDRLQEKARRCLEDSSQCDRATVD